MKMNKLPNMELKFSIQVVGDESKINWVGDFLFGRPTLKERAMIEVAKARLNGDLFSIDPETRAYNEAISFLRFTLRESPDWWKESDYGSNLYDANVVIEVYNKCIAYEAAWRQKVYGKKDKDGLQTPVMDSTESGS